MTEIFDIVLHLDAHLNQWIASLGPWIHAVLFAVIFCETGLVVTPFLPGDSLLFALGAIAATEGSPLRMSTLIALLSTAAVLGNTLNYAVGRHLGPKVFRGERRWLNKRHLEETQRFYDRHGGKTVVITRFLPIVRTFAPFVAGAGGMPFGRFTAFNVAGGLLWVGACLLAGYFFGNIPFVKRHFDIVVAGIIFVSMIPFLIRVVSGYFKKRKAHDSVPERNVG
ncbi:MAG TPA: DedA family protein [bacterium]|nr:DedA family protein [bacterium]